MLPTFHLGVYQGYKLDFHLFFFYVGIYLTARCLSCNSSELDLVLFFYTFMAIILYDIKFDVMLRYIMAVMTQNR